MEITDVHQSSMEIIDVLQSSTEIIDVLQSSTEITDVHQSSMEIIDVPQSSMEITDVPQSSAEIEEYVQSAPSPNVQRLITTTHNRTRRPVQIEEKFKIIAFWEEHRNMSMADISKEFKMPRTTVHGIIKKRDTLLMGQPAVGLNPKRYRRDESRFRILEELLLTTQAFEIHRMLSGLVKKTLPSCTFSSGWRSRFKKRRNISLESARDPHCPVDQDEWRSSVKKHLSRFESKDVYTCGVTSMYLDMLPPQVFGGPCQGPSADGTGTLNASILLCCNASGTVMTQPHVLVRCSHEDFQAWSNETRFSVVNNVCMKTMTASTFGDWLDSFDKLGRPILMLLDQTTWDILQINSGDLREPNRRDSVPPMGSETSFPNITFVRPRSKAKALAPLAIGLVKEFKHNYFRYYLEERMKDRTNTWKPNANGYMDMINRAWEGIQKSTVHRCLEEVTRDRDDCDDAALKEAVMKAYPKAPDYVQQYYLTQDDDIGPSIHLRTTLGKMQYSEDYKSCFGPYNPGQPRFYDGDGMRYRWRAIVTSPDLSETTED
ncbi:Tigger transposable element-derived protein 6 [Modicella reniformis]|uniref:Tigger transposable element-derived protein 6 n=1 Tax=Modicella reniformis TaxID=1440133 RepID=A0A9P6MA55_9FUNG|nr:Tigger transposable element-derived protein 6 [Modicella reniformis]